MVNTPASYTQFLKDHPEFAAELAAPKAPKLNLGGTGTVGAQPVASNTPQSPLSWLTDILSRPLYGIENAFHGAIEHGASEGTKVAKGDVGGAIQEGLQNFSPVPAIVNGIFSADPAQHHTTSENEEFAADTLGKLDPNYKDVADNVNPVLKGITGFAGDIAFDPLTYVPGLDVVGAASKVIKGVRAGTDAATIGGDIAEKLLTKTGKAAVQKVVDKVAPKKTSEAVLGDLAPAIEADPAIPVIDEKEAAAAAKTISKVPVAERPVATPEVPDPVGTQMRANPRSKAMAAILDDVSDSSKQRPVTLPSPETGEPGAALNPSAWLAEHVKLSLASDSHSNMVRVKPVGAAPFDVPLEDVQNILSRKGTSPTKVAVQQAVQDRYLSYRDAFQKAANAKKPGIVDALSRPVQPAKLPKGPLPSETLISQMTRFRELAAQNEAHVEGAFGVDLTAQLKRIQRPEKFEAVTKTLSDMLARTDDLSDVTSFSGNPTMGKMFRALGIDPIAINAARRQAESVVGKVDVTEDPIVQRIRDPKLGAELDVDDKDIVKALPAPLKKNFVDIERYKYESASGIRQTSEGIGEGFGNDVTAMNTHTQWDVLHSLSDVVTERVKKLPGAVGAKRPGKFGLARAQYVRDEVLRKLNRTEQLMDSQGFPMFMDMGGERLPLSMGQALDIMVGTDADNIARTMFNGPNSIPSTNVADAIFQAVKKNASYEDVDAQLEKAFKRNGKQGEIPNPLRDNSPGVQLGFVPKTPNMSKSVLAALKKGKWATDPATGAQTLVIRYEKVSNGWKPIYQAAPLRNTLTAAIMRNVDRFKEVAAENAQAYAQRTNAEVLDLTREQVDTITQMVNDPEQIADALSALANMPQRVAKSAETGGALVPSAEAADTILEASTPDLAVEGAKAAKRATGARERASKAGKTDDEAVDAGTPHMIAVADREADQVLQDTADREAAGAVDPEDAESVDWEASAKVYREANGIRTGKLDPLRSTFNRMYMNDTETWTIMDSGAAAIGKLSHDYRAQLKVIQNNFGGLIEGTETPIIRQAFQDAQKGVNRGGAVGEATTAVRAAMGKLVDLDGKAPLLNNGAFRMNSGLAHLNQRLTGYGLPEIDVDAATRLARENGTSVIEEAAKQWKDWQIDDPIDFMARLHTTMVRLATDHATGMSWGRLAKTNGWSSGTWKPGFVKLNSTAGSAIADSLDRSLWWDKEMLGHLRQVDQITHESTQIGGKFGQFVGKYLDPLMNAWKKGVTIYHVGHHTRNLTGDQSATFLAEGVKGLMSSSRNAYKVLHVRGNYTDVDVQASLEALGEASLPKAGDTLLDGVYGKMSADDLWAWGNQKGLIRLASTIETLGEDAGGKFAQVTDTLALKGTKIEQAAMTVSEYREHYSRMQHFIQIIQREQAKGAKTQSLDKMLDAAADRVKQYHPDRSLLTNFEKKYLTRLFPFYTWFRGMLPAIVESLAVPPGRVNVFNKASYNLAVANGIDPHSLSDPFPDDQLFPSFLTDQMGAGPVTRIGQAYFGISPGIASQDVLNTAVGGNPLRNLAGLLSPAIREPIELATGTNLSTGGKINDTSDYLDSSIPGLNYLANFSGVSPTGTIVSEINGKGVDPQYQVAAGNKSPLDFGASAVNWLTGLGLNDMSKQSYINYAEIEKRNAAAAATQTNKAKADGF